ncbi:MAG: class I SAM-dependent methyltransferase [Planctomycetes bacterium]|nr:class I SAM-dependent methyltransferase [Planctomycetota bacterium]
MQHVEQQFIGKPCTANKAPGHWVLARLGKKVLRPGGLELTQKMLGSLDINRGDSVVEFAPGLGITAKITLERSPKNYIAVDRDENAANTVRQLLAGTPHRCIVGRAEETGLPDHSATVVYGEAMLTMQSPTAKSRIVGEAARLLNPGGRYGIHEIALSPESISNELIDKIRHALGDAIHHVVMPMTSNGWQMLMESQGFEIVAQHVAPMHLLEPRRLVADEGLAGALRFAWNLARDSESRRRVLAMRATFRKYREHLSAIVMVARKVA